MRDPIRRPFRPLQGERGMCITELMVAVTIMSVMVLGLTTVVIVQARQQARDKLLNDMYAYAAMILNEAETSLGASREIERSAVSGGRAKEDLEFMLSGTTNIGRTLETRFTKEGERKLVVRRNNQQTPWSQRFPPAELDPDRRRDLDYRIYVREFRLTAYADRQFLSPRVSNILTEAVLLLELEDKRSDYTVQREFRRVIATPNKHIAQNRAQQASGA